LSELLELLRARIGAEGAPEIAWDPVNQAMIRHWCDALEDDHPAYTDPGSPEAAAFGGIVAPPAMLNAWTMPGLRGRPDGPPGPSGEAYRALDAAGFTSVVATDCEHEYLRYLHLGDHLRGVSHVEDVSAEKATGLGVGHFVTTRTDYRTQHEELVGRMRFRLLKFAPGTGRALAGGRAGADAPSEASEPEAAPEPPPRRTAPFAPGEPTLETPLAPLVLPITPTRIVATAIASRDYQDVHHDPALARKRGSPDIFMNILTTCGFCARFVSDRMGPDARLEALRIRLGVPNYPGDTMTLSGRIATLEPLEDGRRARVEVAGTNRLGPHVTGHVDVRLPG
jgi:acyl dehydratase